MTDKGKLAGKPDHPAPKEPIVEITSDEELAAYERELAQLVQEKDQAARDRISQLEAAILEYREQERGRLEKAYPPESSERDI